MRSATTHTPVGHRALRPLALAVVLLAVWAHLASLAHMALVRHVACAEHGELVHPGEAGHRHSAHGGGNAPEVDADGAASTGEHHDHCAIAAHRREQVSEAASTDAAATVDSVPPSAVLVSPFGPSEQAQAPSVPVYRLAPKTSPPA